MKATKRITRLCSILLAVVIVMAMSVSSAFAGTIGTEEGQVSGSGTITINNPVENETYTIYKIFDTDAKGTGATATEAQKNFYVAQTNNPFVFTLNVTGTYNVSVGTKTVDGEDDESAQVPYTAEEIGSFLKGLLDNESFKGLVDTAEKMYTKDEDGTSLVFDDIPYGYYFVTSSVGSVVMIDSTAPTVTINEKNQAPKIDKDPSTTTASIGQTIDYDVTIIAQEGAKNYVVHDTMSDSLDLVMTDDAPSVPDVTVTLYRATTGEDGTISYDSGTNVLATDNWTATTPGTETGEGVTPCTLEVTFTQTFCDTLKANDKIVIEYSAVVNEKAIETTPTNDVILNYGNNSSTTTETVSTPNYSFDVVKTDGSGKVLDGAQFVLYDKAQKAIVPLTKVAEGSYRVATAEESAAEDFKSATIETLRGKATIDGLGNGTYYLQETKAPEGYNKLDKMVEVTIENADNSATVTEDAYVSGGVQVINETGSELPSTGGMGTTVIYIVGGVLVAGAAVLLVTRRRMHA